MKSTSKTNIKLVNSSNIKLNNFLKHEIKDIKFLIGEMDDIQIKVLFEKLKDEFFDRRIYVWKMRKVFEYVNIENINPNNIIELLELLMPRYFLNRTKGKIFYQKFINKLKKTPSNKLESYKYRGIPLKDTSDFIDFLIEMRKIRNTYLNISHEKFVVFISDNFATSYSESYLKRCYFDNKE